MNQQTTFVLWIQAQLLRMVLQKTMVATKDLVLSLTGNWIRWDRQTDAMLISSPPCILKLANNQMFPYHKLFATSA